MKRFVLTICLAVFFIYNAFTQSYGLQFNSHEALPEKRTALELAPGDPLFFSKDVRLDFDINLLPGQETYFGYVLRIINNHQNIDIIYDQSTSRFRIITGQNFSGIFLALDSAKLFHGWTTISIIIQKSKQKLQILANGKFIGTTNITFTGNKYNFLWGANDYSNYQTRDIPPMRIKDIRLFDDRKLQYYWPLNEVSGNTSLDNERQQKAFIKNPVWIKPAHENWALQQSYTIKGNAVTAFDCRTQTLYIAGSDSVLTCNFKSAQNIWQSRAVNSINLMPGSQAVFDTVTNSLLNVFIDEKKVITYKQNNAGWSSRFYDSLPTEFGHANKFISAADTSLYIIGGYGQLKYKNIVQRYSISKNTWSLVKTKGNFFPPRYLAALGLNTVGDTAFIVGGYGSPSGEQMLNPGNYSDVFAFSVKSKSFKKLFTLDTAFSKYTFANSLVIDSKNHEYYGLVFPNDSFNSNLQIVKGSLNKPSIQFLANKIPYSFYDAQSFADLFYASAAGKLIAVTIFGPKFEDSNKQSIVKVYTIDFPPDAGLNPQPEVVTGRRPNYIWGIAGSLIIVAAVIIFINRKKKIKPQIQQLIATPLPVEKREVHSENETLPVEEEMQYAEIAQPEILPVETMKKNSSIILFGQFQVFDKEEKDITELFTPLIKELFLLIVIYTFRNGRGITSEQLNEILWSGKAVKDAKNNRSVNMVKLKNILEKVGDCAMVKKSNFWQFQCDDTVSIDYQKFIQLAKSGHESDKHQMQQLLGIAGKGAFLLQTEYNWLDDVKAEVSNLVIDLSLQYLHNNKNIYDDLEFVIEIANCIFYFDNLNEDALEYKCKSLIYLKRHALANKTYTKFQKDYKDVYGEEFDKSFTEIIKNMPSHTHN